MKTTINVNSSSLIYAAVLLLILPAKWLTAATLAAIFHEMCHYITIWLTGNEVFEIDISHNGAIMQTTSLSLVSELFCALAGPMGSMLLFFCYPWFPRIALCAAIQCLFNLIPVYPMDGGRILSCMLEMWVPEKKAGIMQGTERVVFLLLLAASLCLRQMFFVTSASILLICRLFLRKIPCKPGKIKVQ